MVCGGYLCHWYLQDADTGFCCRLRHGWLVSQSFITRCIQGCLSGTRGIGRSGGSYVLLDEYRLVCMMHTRNSSDLIKLLMSHGWMLNRSRGSHHVYKHPIKSGHITVPHPKKDLGQGIVKSILKQAGIEG